MQLTLHVLNSNRFPGDDGEEEKTVGKIDAVTVRHRTPATKRDYATTSRKKWGKRKEKRAIVTPTTLVPRPHPPSARAIVATSPQAGWGPELLLSPFSSELTPLQCLLTNTTSGAEAPPEIPSGRL